MRQEIIDLYDDYTHSRLDRRVFMDRLATLAGGTAAATALLPILRNNYAKAAIVPEDDPAVQTERVTLPGASGEMQGYLARPANASGELPGVVVIHENRGLNPHTEDVARRMALEGFVALAPDFLSPQGGTPGDEDQAREMIASSIRSRPSRTRSPPSNFSRATRLRPGGRRDRLLLGRRAGQSGGGDSPDVAAVVPFYGRQPASEDVANIQAPVLLHYAGIDERINAGIPEYEQALQEAGVDYTIHMYEGANHAFLNDTNEARYDQEAAELAWSRTVDFLKVHLAG